MKAETTRRLFQACAWALCVKCKQLADGSLDALAGDGDEQLDAAQAAAGELA
jgi:hypothetical protein